MLQNKQEPEIVAKTPGRATLDIGNDKIRTIHNDSKIKDRVGGWTAKIEKFKEKDGEWIVVLREISELGVDGEMSLNRFAEKLRKNEIEINPSKKGFC